MAGDVRTVIQGIGQKFPSREPGDPTGMSINIFLMQKLQEGITGQELQEIATEALSIAEGIAQDEWPVDTGASNDSIRIEEIETGAKHARAALVVGGEPLKEDPRNEKGIDYAPFIEFNGSPGGTPPGTMVHAMALAQPEMVDLIKQRVSELIKGLVGGTE